MKIWSVDEPVETAFAAAQSLSGCNRADPEEALVYPEVNRLEVGWLKGSDIVGDFVFCEPGLLVRQTCATLLLKSFPELKQGDFSFIDRRQLGLWRRQNVGLRKRVTLPYAGPKLVRILVDAQVHPDLEHSSFRLQRFKRDPDEQYVHLGKTITEDIEYRFSGFERVELDSSGETYKRIKRRRGKGIFVRKRDLKGRHFFRIYSGSPAVFYNTFAALFCTDVGKAFIEERGFSNVAFREYGELV